MNAASSGKSTVDRLFDAIDKLGDNVGRLQVDVGVLLADRKPAREQRERTYEKVEAVESRVAKIENGLAANTTITAEMSVEMQAIQTDIADYRIKREFVAPALAEIRELKNTIESLRRDRAYEAGLWAAIKNASLTAKSIIGGAIMLAGAGIVAFGVEIAKRWL